MTEDTQFDPLVPRPIDQPTPVPLEPGADLSVLDDAKILAAPNDPRLWPAWRRALATWATDAKTRTQHDGATYTDPASVWTQTAYSVALVWLWDEQLYDHATHRFTVEKFLAVSTQAFGGFDAVVLWHAYPVIGIDPRNQFDYYRDIPGLADRVAEFQAAGVRVFLDYNPWDTGTRRTGRDDAQECADLITDTGADGLFLDTLKQGDPRLVAALRLLGRPVALEGESRLPLDRIADHALSWAQWFADSPVPGVLRAHLYERRHMLHHTRRWNRDHGAELQSAWLNGCGILVWECVFGSWVGWNARDRSTLRRMRLVFAAFADLLLAGQWAPLADIGGAASASGVYASRFADTDRALYLLVNRGDEAAALPCLPAGPGRRSVCLDTGRGEIEIPAGGIAAVLELPDGPLPAIVTKLVEQLARQPWESGSTFPRRPVHRVATPTAAGPPDAAAVVIPAGEYQITQTYRRRETGWYGSVPYVEEWKPLPPRLHDLRSDSRTVQVRGAAVDACEVTRRQFDRFVTESGYRPAVGNRFPTGPPAPGSADEPVTQVDLADARAYARWRGARLPTEFEWQLAAKSGGFRRGEPIVWNWTESEHTDGRTRFAILKGGSAFAAKGSDWYTDGGVQPPEYGLQIPLLGLGLARSACIGFRCAVDLLADRPRPGRSR